MTRLDVRWVLHAALGDPLGEAPEPLSFEASVPASDAGSMRLSYSALAAAGHLFDRALTAGTEVALEVSDGSGWVEPDGCRFLLLDRSSDILDDQEVRVAQGPSYLWLASKVRSLNVAALNPEGHSEEGKRPFLSATPGMIVGTLLTEAEAAGMEPFSWTFTATHDSDGQPWDKVVTWHVAHGITLDVLIQQLVAAGACEVTTRGRELVLTNPGGLSPDLSATVRYDAEAHMVTAPGEESIAELAARFHFSGGDGLQEAWTETSAPTPWGAWQWHDSNDSISDAGTAQALLQETARYSGRLRGQYVRDLVNPGPEVWPLLDFGPGAWVTAPTDSPAERVRVAEVIVRAGEEGEAVPSLVLNDRLLDEAERQARRRAGIVGGSSTPGGSTVRPTPTGPDKRKPAAPLGLVVSSAAYIDAGRPAGQVTGTWDAVTAARAADGGGLIEVARYNFYRRSTDELFTQPWEQVAATVDGTTSVSHSPYPVGSGWEFAVQAVSADGVPGDLSAPVAVTIADDTTPPPVPSAGTITMDKGLAFVHWDGLTADGMDMPGDFSHVRLWVGESMAPPAMSAPSVARRYGPGRELLPPEPYGVTRYARWQAVDVSGNRSAWSEPVEFVTMEFSPEMVEAQGRIDEAMDQAAAAQADATAAHSLASQASLDAAAAHNAAVEAGDVAYAADAKASAAVTGTVIEYAVSSSESTPPSSGWSTATPTRAPGAYVWMRTVVTYGDATTSTTNPVLVTGNAGSPGEPGADGTSVSIKGRVATSSALPTSGNTAGDGWIAEDTGHLWVWTGSEWTDAGLIRGPEGPPGEDGDPGAPGDPGVSVVSVTPFYRRQSSSAAAPSKPTTMNPPTGWTSTEPDYLEGNSLYRSERVVYSNGSFAWTDVTKVTAWEIAASALVSANGKNSRITSTSPATGTTNPNTGLPNVEGDTWWQWDSTSTRNVIGQWTWDGDGWRPELIHSEVIANLDVNKLVVTGSARMAQAVVDKIIGDAAHFGVITAEQLVVAPGNLFPDPYFVAYGTKWHGADTVAVTDADMPGGTGLRIVSATAQRGAYYGTADAFSVQVEPGAEYRVRATVKVEGSAPQALRFYLRGISTAGTAVLASVILVPASAMAGVEVYEARVVIPSTMADGRANVGLFTATPYHAGATFTIGGVSLTRMVGGVLIEDGAITAPKILAGTIDGTHIGTVNLTATGVINAPYSDGSEVRLQGGDGLQYLIPVPDDHGGSSLVPISQFGRDFMQWDGATGSMLAQVVDGEGSFRSVSTADDLVIAGRPLLGLDEATRTSSYEWDRAWGIVPGGFADMASWVPSSFNDRTIHGIGQVEVEMHPGRLYRVSTSQCPVDMTAVSSSGRSSITGFIYYRATIDGTEPGDPTPVHTQLVSQQTWVPTIHTGPAPGPDAAVTGYHWYSDVGRRVKFLYAVRLVNATGIPGGTFDKSSWRLTVEDIGPVPVSTGKQNNSSLAQGSSTPTTPPAGSTKRTYTTRWYASARANYQGSVRYDSYPGGHRAGQGWLSNFNAGPRHSYLSFTGTAHWSTGSGEVGKTITQALSGASNVKVRYRVGNANSVRSSVPIIIGTASSVGGARTNRATQTVPRGSTRTVDLSIGSWLQSSTSNRHITHGPGSQVHATYYADIPWSSSEPTAMRAYLEITYER